MNNKPLSKTDLEYWKAILAEERRRVTEQLRHVEEDVLKKSQRDATGDLSGYSFHMADVGTDNFDREVTLAHASNGQGIIFQIDEALKRVNEGTFGMCTSCGKPIKKERLKAVPYTTLCVPCKSQEESRPVPPSQT
ncbi:MAG: TraR/DksA C4-type zinc finger protein [Candidatus Omnitrophica bacterium]|nr:TraR/DksA C4-type zinc finger protein [Candidatus Omnitrophota bacterium]